jgi:membrane associated rhomboid family serine protease
MATSKIPFALLFGVAFIFINILNLVFRRGENDAYYAMAVFGVVVGIVLVSWHLRKSRSTHR